MRFNIYDLPHKALRNCFNQFNLQIGNSNYQSQKEIDAIKNNMLRLMALLSSHSHIEDTLLLKPLIQKGITTLNTDFEEHYDLDNHVFRLSVLIQSLKANSETIIEQSRTIYLLFNQFHGKYLLHMYREESETLPIIWENMSDEELFTVREKIMQKTPERIMDDWYYYCLPAQTEIERKLVLKGAKEYAKTIKDWSRIKEIAKTVLTDKEFETAMRF